MNSYFRALFVTLLTAASFSTFASISCSKPKLSKPVELKNAIYNFKATVTCNLVGETIDLKAIKEAYLSDITAKGSQFVIKSQQEYEDKKGMKGYSLDVVQNYDSPNGSLSVRANVILADNNATDFVLDYRSKSIVGEDKAQYNKLIINGVKYQHSAESDEVIVTKEIEVEQPWYAPQDSFFEKVQGDLADSIRKSAMLQARKIRGEKVDALRK